MDKQLEILNAALKLFAEFGFHATPTSKIAKEAGVANGTLFHYYKTKEDLILALYTTIKGKLNIEMYKGLKEGTDLKELLRTIYFNTLKWTADHKQEFYFVQQFNTSPFLSLISSEELARQTKPHLELLEAGIKNKTFKNLPETLLFVLINNHIYGMTQYLNTQAFSTPERDKLMVQSFDLLWDMVSVKQKG